MKSDRRGAGGRSRRRRHWGVEGLESRRLLAVTINEFPTLTPNADPEGITAGPDGNLWFTELGGKIGRITPTGTVAEFPIPTANAAPKGITAGPDGNLWFTETGGNKIGKISTAGTFLGEFTVPTAKSSPVGITAGPDGNLWFTETDGNKIGKISTAGTFLGEFTLPAANSFASGITVGPDGNLWFMETGRVGKITTAGTITEFPRPLEGALTALAITTGPDGNLWFTLASSNIGRITPTGTVTEFPTPTNGETLGMTTGSDGNLWFTELQANNIGQITPAGTVTEFPIPTANSNPVEITTGSDGNLWFTQEGSISAIGQAVISAPVVTATRTQLVGVPNPSTVGQAVAFTAVVSPQTGAAIPTGTVTFSIDGAAEPAVPLAVVGGKDQASFSTSTLTAGRHTVTAIYNPQGNFGGSTSNTATQVVNAIPVVTATRTQLVGVPNPSTVGQAVAFTAVVSPQTGAAIPTGTVTFSIDGAAEPAVPLAVVGGKDQASFSTSTLTAGRHTVTAIYNPQGNFGGSTSNAATQVVNAIPVVSDGPRVLAVQRFGFHAQPTTLVLAFSSALDPARAQDPANYQVLGPNGRPVAITSAVYDPAARTVTLAPDHQLDLHGIYRLTVIGRGPRGVSDAAGQLLDGAQTGRPGSSYVATLTAADLVLGAVVPGGPARLARLQRTVARLAAHQLALLSRRQGIGRA